MATSFLYAGTASTPHNTPSKRRAWSKQYYKDHPALMKKMALKKYSTPVSRVTYMLNGTKARAKRKSIEFALTHDWLLEKIHKGVCEVSGLPFELEGEGANRPWSPSLDRINPKLGYTTDNVQVVCWMYNAAKGVATDADVLTLAEALCRIPAKK